MPPERAADDGWDAEDGAAPDIRREEDVLAAARERALNGRAPADGGEPNDFRSRPLPLEDLSAAGRRGAAKTQATLMKRRERAKRFIEDAMRDAASERIEMMLRPYWEALSLEPRDDWSPATKLSFYMDQTTVAEKVASRLEGLPVARRRDVDEDGRDRASLSHVPTQALEGALKSALTSAARELAEGQSRFGPSDAFDVEVEVPDG